MSPGNAQMYRANQMLSQDQQQHATNLYNRHTSGPMQPTGVYRQQQQPQQQSQQQQSQQHHHHQQSQNNYYRPGSN